ncbi:MAG: hypothetical protein ABIO49_04180 [Dokdonella sp.]
MNRSFLQGMRVRAVDAAATIVCIAAMASPLQAAQTDIVGPADSGAFGTSVTVLPNGNIVITDPEAGASKTGAVYLYGPDGRQISRLTGSSPNDRVGSSGIVIVGSGNFVICSPHWTNAGAVDAGAATWVDARLGLSGLVSRRNSLVGATMEDEACRGADSIVTLSNGNYVVASPYWNNGITVDGGSGIGVHGGGGFGAVTWGSGTSGVIGDISAANSLIGTTEGDHVGDSVTALSNGNYVVASPDWANGVADAQFGAVTWANGATGLRGTVSTSNSLVGAVAGDQVGARDLGLSGVTALSNGNYVVASAFWNNRVGAATWGNGASATTGLISAANSLIGTTTADWVGADGITALSNGNYVVVSSSWSYGVPDSPVGAATWGNGATGTVGAVSSGNSLIGTTARDYVGANVILAPISVTALSNGNYVVASPRWGDGRSPLLGAVTWADGKKGIAGFISSGNSLVGTVGGGLVGESGVTALSNGNYVVNSSGDFAFVGSRNADAATWVDGNTGATGFVSPANSLMGHISSITALSNGNYVMVGGVGDGTMNNARSIAIWGDGASVTLGSVSAATSVVDLGTSPFAIAVTALSNGNYAVTNSAWSNGISGHNLGATTWVNGAAPTTGTISASNSLIGTLTGDEVGSGGVVALSDGNYVVITVGRVASTVFGQDPSPAVPGGVTLMDGRFGHAGTFRSSETVIGGWVYSYDPTRKQLAVGRPQDSIVTLLTLPPDAGSGHSRRAMPQVLGLHESTRH